MNRYILIRRLRGPVFLVAIGVLALLAQSHVLSFGRSWPLLLILLGVLKLAERAAMAADGPSAYSVPYSSASYPASYPGPCASGTPGVGQPLAEPASVSVPEPLSETPPEPANAPYNAQSIHPQGVSPIAHEGKHEGKEEQSR